MIERYSHKSWYGAWDHFDLKVNGRIMRPISRADIFVKTSQHTIRRLVRAGIIGLYRVRGYRFDYIAADELEAAIQAIESKDLILPGADRYAPDAELRQAVIERDKWMCRYCGTDLKEETPHIDHLLPFLRGGGTAQSNLVTSCSRCNRRKANRTPEEARMNLLPIETDDTEAQWN